MFSFNVLISGAVTWYYNDYNIIIFYKQIRILGYLYFSLSLIETDKS
jgi:hypothetical protein